MAYSVPVRTADDEYVTNPETGEVEKVIEHFAQGDLRYRIVHNMSSELTQEDSDKPLFRTFSKLSLEDVLFKEGVLDAVDSFIDSQTVTNDKGQTMPLRRKYDTALEFSEAHPLFKPAVKQIQQILGWTDEKVEEILNSCANW